MDYSKFTTGQFAKICNTTKETIYHYTENGLLHAEKSNENGYFYYSAFEYFEFLLIKSLRECDCSIKEIKDYIFQYGPSKSLELLKERQTILQNKIKRLEQTNTLISDIISSTEDALSSPRNIPSIIYCPATYFISSPLHERFSLNTTVKRLSSHINNHFMHCMKYGVFNVYPLGSIISAEDFRNNGYIQTHFISEISQAQADSIPCNTIFPKGEYVVINHTGGYDNPNTLKNTTQHILAFLKKKQYEISGDGYAIDTIGHMASRSFDNFIIRLCFPVTKL